MKSTKSIKALASVDQRPLSENQAAPATLANSQQDSTRRDDNDNRNARSGRGDIAGHD